MYRNPDEEEQDQNADAGAEAAAASQAGGDDEGTDANGSPVSQADGE